MVVMTVHLDEAYERLEIALHRWVFAFRHSRGENSMPHAISRVAHRLIEVGEVQ
jgi:hypothetical protein